MIKTSLRKIAKTAWHFGLNRYCPCCRSHLRKFRSAGVIPRPDAACPACGAVERHRLTLLYMQQRTDLFDGRPKSMLHVAPEPQLARIFRKRTEIDYLSADLSQPRVMVRMDITDIQYPDNTFDVIYCSHVLEHVPDDRKAMRELRRVLKPSGWAILAVPITAEATFEDWSITTPEGREQVFGQHDHVRRYGPDYKDRLEEAGFAVTVDGFAGELDDRTVRRMRLRRTESIHLCRKMAA